MPIYEYKCSKCGDSKEVFARVSLRNDTVSCGCNNTMTRIISCNIERMEPTYLPSMIDMLPPSERDKVYDRLSLNRAMDRSGLVCT